MSEPILMALVQLFAIIAASNKQRVTENARKILESYLDRHLNAQELDEYLKLFDELILFHTPEEDEAPQEEILIKTIGICNRLRKQLTAADRILVLIKYIEFCHELSTDDQLHRDENFHAFISAFRDALNVSPPDAENALRFIIAPDTVGPHPENTLMISAGSANPETETRHIRRDHLTGKIVCLFIPSVRMLLGRYLGTDPMYLNGHVLPPGRSFVLSQGAILKNPKIAPVYYSDIASLFHKDSEKVNIEFTAQEIEFRFKNNVTGLHPFSFTAKSGELIGVMGGSGVGKSTLLNVLNGNLRLSSGAIHINGVDLEKEREKLEGVIGFVPQDDLLIDELTVFQNLYYNARLCFRDASKKELIRNCMRVLRDIDLAGTRNLTVGDPLNKFISGGQRKRLNIALELIRQPSVLFADEPTSGLSSMDSEMVMLLLKEQTLKGRLVVVNIHQPSSDIFKLFDKLLIMDKGGYPVFYGNPIDAITYFKTAGNHANPDESECEQCGYVNPEQLLQITEARIVNEYGRFTGNRKKSPKEWYTHFREHIQPQLAISREHIPVPASAFRIPGLFKQFRIFSVRNFLTKVTNRQYLIINLLEAPFLAALLAWLTRYRFGEVYHFGQNKNLVAYLFMSVVVSLFLGMMVSAEEIIKDRRILKREAFLNLSRFSYLNAKIVLLFALSAIQTTLYVVTGNLILDIQGMNFSFWLILFATTCFANMVGLNISSGLDSVVAIYILIPFILVPQLLLSGTVVPFDNLNPAIASREHVPAIGNMMTSRWTFEAMAVEQYSKNEWERHFFRYDKPISKYKYYTAYLIPALESTIDEISMNQVKKQNQEKTRMLIRTLQNELPGLRREALPGRPEQTNIAGLSFISDSLKESLKSELDTLSRFLSAKMNSLVSRRDAVYLGLVKQYGEEKVLLLKLGNSNRNLAELVTNALGENKIVMDNGKLIRKYEPVYMDPVSRCGNAHLYAPVKQLGSWQIETLWFNFAVIWLMTLILYLTLLHDTLRKSIGFFGRITFPRRSPSRKA